METDETTVKNEEQSVRPMSKYSIIPKFWNSPKEVAAIDLVASYDDTGRMYLTFIDGDGGMWKGNFDDFVIIRNFPDQEDIEDFQRLKKESEVNREIIHKKRLELEKNKDKRDGAFI